MINKNSTYEPLHIFETGHSGHVLVYIKLLVQEALKSGRDVTIYTTNEVLASAEYAEHLSSVAPHVRIFILNRPDSRALFQVLKNVRTGTVLIPHADPLLKELIWFGFLHREHVHVRALIMRDPRWEMKSSFARLPKLLLKLATIWLISAYISGIDILWLRGTTESGHSGEAAVVDPYISEVSVDETRRKGELFRNSHLVAADYWFVVAGSITPRKNLGLITSSLREFASGRSDRRFGLLIAGPIYDDNFDLLSEISLLEKAGISTHIENRLLDNESLNYQIAAADALVMAYSSHSPNSTLVKARVHGVKTVVLGPRSLRDFASQVGADYVDTLSETALLAGLQTVLDSGSTIDYLSPPTPGEFYSALCGSSQ